MMKNLIFIAFVMIFMLASCMNENEVLNDSPVDQKESYSHSVVTVDGVETPYLTFSDFDSVSMGDTICNFSEITVDESMRPANLRSIIDPSILACKTDGLDELFDFPVNIIVRESNSSARYLTNQGLNKELCLANYDANNNVKQTFYLVKSFNTFAPFYIETPVLTSIFPLKRFQRKPIIGGSTNNTNASVVFVGDGKEQTTSPTWCITPSRRDIAGDGAYIFSFGLLGLRPGCNMQSEGTKIRLGDYTTKGTQEFIIRPMDEFEMTSLELIVDNSSYAVRKPDFVVNWDYNNNYNSDQEISTNFSRKAVRTSNFSRKHSVSLNVTTSLDVGGAFFIGGSITLATSNTHEWTYGKTESTEDTRTYNFPLKILKNTRVHATLSVAQYEMNLKYRAQFQGKTTGKIFTEIGDWKGVDCTDIRVDVQGTDVYGNTSTQTFYGVPTSRVVVGSN